uniref:Uncharacterized protein n=1 Tax=Candidatus Kentrum sp. SD TaxID=2126332 RepID=A0A451BHE2_9GAMM|nr:MAG: hypothetical protein BECKSD772D_GA0070982_10017 [Candidatus Kentron sp. SD]
MHKTTTRFRCGFDALLPEIRKIARRNYALLEENPRYPSLVPTRPADRNSIAHRGVKIWDLICFDPSRPNSAFFQLGAKGFIHALSTARQL